MSWIRIVIAELGRGDGQPRDWYGWVTNQCGHVLVGLMLTGGGIAVGAAADVAALAVAGLYALKEWGDWRRGGKLGDSLVDILFVCGGIALALSLASNSAAGFFITWIIVTLMAAYGIRQRIKRGNDA